MEITLRDKMAIEAMKIYLEKHSVVTVDYFDKNISIVAALSYKAADAMIGERGDVVEGFTTGGEETWFVGDIE